MNDEISNRRLTTVLALDAVGYSRLVAMDERGAVARFKHLHDTIFAPLCERRRGRIVKAMGDGLLMEFTSVVDAVDFAVQATRGVAAANTETPADRRMDFRIGINIGDVIVDGDDLFGAGVNVAARLEALAPPGGICVSGTVHEHVRGKTEVGFEDLGRHRVKNIPEPVRVFRVVVDDPPGAAAGAGPRRRTVMRRAAVGALAAAALALIGYAIHTLTAPDDAAGKVASVERLAFPLPDKPSIAVLPFKNLSDQQAEEIFADGVTEDLITDLSKVSGLFVIARNSSFEFRDTDVDIGEIAERLGVRYLLEGSVRRAGDQVRVNTQLIDTTTGANVWAERFDGEISDIFGMQDQIVVTAVNALRLTLTDLEKSEISKTDTRLLDAKAAFQQGWALYSRFNERDNAKAEPFFKEAIRLDPEYGRAYGALALVYLRGSAFGWDRALGRQESTLRYELAPKNLKEAEKYGTSLVHVVRAMQSLFYRHTDRPTGSNAGTDDARREAGAAIAAQPSDPEAHIMMAWALIAAGKNREGLNFVKSAERLNPNHSAHYLIFEAAALIGLNDLEGAAAILRKGLEQDPEATEMAPLAASVFAILGLRSEAAAMLKLWRPGARRDEIEFAIAHYRFPVTWVPTFNRLNTRLIDGLHLAALSGEVTVLSLMNDLESDGGARGADLIRKLGWFGPAAAPAVPVLVAALRGDDKRARREAAVALGKVGPAAGAALPELRAIVDAPLVGFHAAAAIRAISGDR